MTTENKNTPAFPPQIAQDNFGRIVVAVPGMSKLEYFSLQLLPTYLTIPNLQHNGNKITASQAAINKAIELLEALESHNKPEEAKIIE
jgi:hypothetical protein